MKSSRNIKPISSSDSFSGYSDELWSASERDGTTEVSENFENSDADEISDLTSEVPSVENIDVPEIRKIKYRKVKAPKQFSFTLNKNSWEKIKPTISKPRDLRSGYMDVLYDKFHKINKECVPTVIKQHVYGRFKTQVQSSTSGIAAYAGVRTICKYEGCGEFFFTIYAKKDVQPPLRVVVKKTKNGSFKHNIRESQARHLKGEKRKNLQKKAIRDKLTGGDIFKKIK